MNPVAGIANWIADIANVARPIISEARISYSYIAGICQGRAHIRTITITRATIIVAGTSLAIIAASSAKPAAAPPCATLLAASAGVAISATRRTARIIAAIIAAAF